MFGLEVGVKEVGVKSGIGGPKQRNAE